jgi:anti-sigma regulatory factor (Ser/Thr protein kinase)
VARAAVHEFCEDQGLGGNDAAQLVASELVTNAVVHAGTPIDLTLRLVTSQLHIAVRDLSTGQARIGGIVDESSESGRGLLLVDALASAWGTLLPDVGKVVWATVRIKPRHVLA